MRRRHEPLGLFEHPTVDIPGDLGTATARGTSVRSRSALRPAFRSAGRSPWTATNLAGTYHTGTTAAAAGRHAVDPDQPSSGSPFIAAPLRGVARCQPPDGAGTQADTPTCLVAATIWLVPATSSSSWSSATGREKWYPWSRS